MADEDYFGPALPPKTAETDETENSSRKPHCKRKRSASSSSDCSSSSSSSSSSSDSGSHKKHRRLSNEEPAQVKTVTAKHYGVAERPNTDSSVNSFIGPVIPTGFLTNNDEEDDNGQDWGPTPPGDDDNVIESTAAEIERRAQRMKNKLLNKDDGTQNDVKPERESWMMELPPERTKNFALAPRTFSMAVPSANMDRSSWTDTPADRAKKEQDLLSGKLPTVEKVPHESSRLAQRDAEYAEQIEEYNKSKKREKSLLELHTEKKSKGHKKNKQKTEKHKDKKKKKKGQDEDEEKEKKKKKSKKKEKAPERRPFDRDVDLKVSQMDNAQRQAIIKRSQQLTGRFGHGSSVGKFL